MKKILRLVFNIIVFILAIWLVVAHRRPASLLNLGKMTLGLSLLFFLLYSYNKKYT